jgi:hypothetical protein
MAYRKLTFPQDRGDWLDAVGRSHSDFYHDPDYVARCAEDEGGRAILIEITLSSGKLMVPLIVRALPDRSGDDAISPYGYPGPLVIADRSASTSQLIAEAAKEFRRFLTTERLVSAFIRMHPILTPVSDAWEKWGVMVRHGDTVSIDLTQPSEVRRRLMRKNLRRDIRTLRDAGVSVYDDTEWHNLPKFIQIYNETMHRVQAPARYFFSNDYYKSLRRIFGKDAHLIVSEYSGQIVAAALFVRKGKIVQYHLAGSLESARSSSPMKLILDLACDYFSGQGAGILHLGGGVGGENDSLYNFKRGFSPNISPFSSLRIIGDSAAYAAACREIGVDPDELSMGYFPRYRGGSTPDGAGRGASRMQFPTRWDS